MQTGLRIETFNLTKRFSNFTAVNKLNLNIKAGESYGFLGPNGAGKTTTILMILGIYRPTEGEVLINGERINRSSFALKRRIGVVAEYQSFYDEMSAWEYLMFFARLYRTDNAERRGQELLEQLTIWEWRDVLIGGYSTGMKKKLGFARALIHYPDLLILDEPVSGLDPFGIIQVREIIKNEQARGCTILISSHILSEVERTVDRVGIIANGELIHQDSMKNIRKDVSGFDRIELKFSEVSDLDVTKLRSLPYIMDIERDGNKIILEVKRDKDHSEDIGRFALKNQLVIIEMKRIEKTLEDAFITITENNLTKLTGSSGNKS